jgi:hypothetical protein
MNTEELKMVLDALSKISGDAGGAAQWWLIAHYGSGILQGLFWVVGILGGIYMIVTVLAGAIQGADEWAAYGKHCARLFGGQGGTYPHESDRVRIAETLAELKRLRDQK